ncbi:MAG: hypothetical protein U9R66_05135 [Thermodesulfobacteriota bacterium]|nr:hypothetical protein [Thermodesulfobacteriota bacterium]
MFPEQTRILNNEKGIGLLGAIFVIVILALFGLLIARYTQTTSVSSAEDYLWAQALYSAESGIRLRMLEHDEGGNWSSWSGYPDVKNFSVSEVSSSLQSPGNPSFIRAKASRNQIVRELEVKYVK